MCVIWSNGFIGITLNTNNYLLDRIPQTVIQAMMIVWRIKVKVKVGLVKVNLDDFF